MQGPSMRPCKFENEAIFSKDMRPKYRLRCISGDYGMPREKHDTGAELPYPLEVCAYDAQLTQNNGERDNGDQSRLRAVNGAAI